ncbi:hypothetical protein Tco_1195592 [Tanacetum coccineum]
MIENNEFVELDENTDDNKETQTVVMDHVQNPLTLEDDEVKSVSELEQKLETEANNDLLVNDDSESHVVNRIAPVAIIDRQLPFEYIIASRSTNVIVMALAAQNVNHSAFKSMFEREKLSGLNFNNWFRSLKLVLKVEKKLYVIEQPIPPAPPAAGSIDQAFMKWSAIYDAHNEVDCLMLGSMTPKLHRQFENSSPYDMIQELKSMFEKQAGVERFDLIQTFHACKQEEGKSVGSFVIKMKGHMEQLKRLGYVLRKGKGKGKGKDKLVYAPKPKNPKPSAKEHPSKDDACHHYKEVGNWKRNCLVYLAKLMKKKKNTGSVSSLGYPKETMGYCFYFPHENKIVVARYAEFLEKSLIFQKASKC